MLKVACLPSHPLEKLVARKKRRGREAVYEASLPPVVEVLGATLIQKKGNRRFPTLSGFRNRNHLSLRLLHPSTFFSIAVRSKKSQG